MDVKASLKKIQDEAHDGLNEPSKWTYARLETIHKLVTEVINHVNSHKVILFEEINNVRQA